MNAMAFVVFKQKGSKMKKKLGAPSKGRKGEIVSFNCWAKNLNKIEKLKKKNKLSERLNELIEYGIR